MNYKLPGGGGGGGGKDNIISEVLGGALTVGAIILFFASPLGSIFFAITNSLFLLALITPVVLFAAFNIWKSLNTIQGACPNCGAPQQTVMKDPDQVSLCFNCGAFIKASSDLKSIEITAPNRGGRSGDFIDMDQPGAGAGGGADFGSVMDQMFGGGGGGSSPASVKEKAQKFKRDTTIIDVDFDKDDK